MSRIGLSVFLAIVVAAALVSTAPAEIKIAKIRFDPPGADTGSNSSINKEWIILRNTGNSRTAVGGWRIRDRDGHVFVFPARARIGAGDRVEIHTGKGSGSAHHRYWDQDNYVWDNDGDRATLKRPHGRVVDTCSYSGSGSSKVC